MDAQKSVETATFHQQVIDSTQAVTIEQSSNTMNRDIGVLLSTTAPVISKADILLQLKQSIDNLSYRMDSFENTIASKIGRLESGYNQLDSKINDISMR
jgi:hypothetical protein